MGLENRTYKLQSMKTSGTELKCDLNPYPAPKPVKGKPAPIVRIRCTIPLTRNGGYIPAQVPFIEYLYANHPWEDKKPARGNLIWIQRWETTKSYLKKMATDGKAFQLACLQLQNFTTETT